MSRPYVITAPVFYARPSSNQVRLEVEEKEEEEKKKTITRQLLVRSLSDSAKTGRNNHNNNIVPNSHFSTVQRRVFEVEDDEDTFWLVETPPDEALRSLSESCLLTAMEEEEEEEEAAAAMTSQAAAAAAALVASNVDDDEEEVCCNCGCGVAPAFPTPKKGGGLAAPTLNPSSLAASDELEDSNVDSEDEGCYLLPGSRFDPILVEREKEKKDSKTIAQDAGSYSNNSSGKGRKGSASVMYVDSKEDRRSFSMSVDSGRSSNTGTLLLHNSSTNSSTKSANSSPNYSSGEEEDRDNGVKIVSHSFSNFVSSKKKKKETVNNKKEEEEEKEEENIFPGNKVTVFVPFSAISDIKRRESVTAKRNKSRDESRVNVTDVFTDNVVICDTQVILRINSSCDGGAMEKEKAEATSSKRQRGLNKRMARRMTTTVAVYEMVNANQEASLDEEEENDESSGVKEDKDLEESLVDEQASSSSSSTKEEEEVSIRTAPAKSAGPRRKDLCKLLGLIEYDVATDATSPEDIKVAQRVALDNLITAIQAQQQQKKVEEQQQQQNQNGPAKAKKKDLAKFLGVENGTATISNKKASSSSLARTSSTRESKSPGGHLGPKSILVNWSQLMKSSMKWREGGSSQDRSGANHHSSTLDSDCGLEDMLDFTQLKSANEVVFGPSGRQRTNRKDLNKFLGLDDSDSEEMVFIQNKKNKKVVISEGEHAGGSKAAGNPHDSSLARSEQGSSSVSVVGIRIGSADGEEIHEDELVGNVSSEESSLSSSPTSTLDSGQIKSSLNNFLRKSSSRQYYSPSQQHHPMSKLPFRSLSSVARKNGGSKRVSDKSSSLGSGGQKTTDEDEDEEGQEDQEEDFLHPPRKSVLFKEYNFSVEESIAQGLPIIPGDEDIDLVHHHLTPSSSRQQLLLKERKKKKDATRRSAEIQLQSHHHRQRPLQDQHHLQPPPQLPPVSGDKSPSLEMLLRMANQEWLEENLREDSATRRGHQHHHPAKPRSESLDAMMDRSSSKKPSKKIQRGAMVRRHRMLIPESGGNPMYLDLAARSPPGYYRQQQQPQRRQYMPAQFNVMPQYHPHHPHHPHHFAPMVSYSPNGRIRFVRARGGGSHQAQDYLDVHELQKALQA